MYYYYTAQEDLETETSTHAGNVVLIIAICNAINETCQIGPPHSPAVYELSVIMLSGHRSAS